MRSSTFMGKFIYFQIAFVLFGLFLNFYLIPCAVVSGVKAMSQDCGKTYPVEVVWQGNWFCPTNKLTK